MRSLLIRCLCLFLITAAQAAPTGNTAPTAYIGGYVNSTKPLFAYDEILIVGMGSDIDGDALTYSWDFGDGTAGTGEMVYHRFLKDGSYDVVLTVSDGTAQASDRRTLEISYQSIVSWTSTATGDAQIFRNAEVNYGATDRMNVYNGEYPDYRALLSFDIGVRPTSPSDDALFLGSFVELSCLKGNQASPKTQLFALTRPWIEGTGSAGGTSGTTWRTYDGTGKWTNAGGDFDQTLDFGFGPNGVVSELYVRDTGARAAYDATALVDAWWTGAMPNNGILIGMPTDLYYKGIEYASSEHADPALRPRIAHRYIVGNFVRNGEAKQDLSGWSKIGTTQASVVSEGSDKVFKIAQGSLEGGLYQSIDVSRIEALDSGALRLKVSAQMRAEIDGADAGLPFLTVQVYGKTGTPLGEGSTPAVASTAWALQSFSLSLPAEASKVLVYLKRSASGRRAATANPAAYFDTVALSISKAK